MLYKIINEVVYLYNKSISMVVYGLRDFYDLTIKKKFLNL